MILAIGLAEAVAIYSLIVAIIIALIVPALDAAVLFPTIVL